MNLQEYRNLQEAYLDVVMGEGKSSRPRYPAGRGVLDQETRDEKREASAENMRGHTEGPGTVTKNPKKLRKQKSMGELGEQKNIYDIIISHLLDEGYADTEEAAERIMVNMSEEWSQSIISEGPNYDKNRQRAAKRAAERNEARKRGQTGSVPGIGYVSPRPERETYRDAAGVERHTSGARMPKKDEGDK